MAKSYTGIFARTLTISDFNDDAFDGISIIANVPVELTYQVLPGNELAFGAGSQSLGGVRTARVFQIAPFDNQATAVAVPCKFRLIYADSNRVRQTVIREDQTTNVASLVQTGTQASFLPETTGMRVGAYSYLVIQLSPNATSPGNAFSTANTTIQIPVTNYTLATASGQ